MDKLTKYRAQVGSAVAAEKKFWFAIVASEQSSFYLGPFEEEQDAQRAKEKLDIALDGINALVCKGQENG